ncbi:hypothetical protein, partial [Kitasatospora sp. GP82]|uniref:hypothetical protein n=1 Tax=Kitasatospora sp. GP82 TaxID=3035089 RepID=UPI0024748A12
MSESLLNYWSVREQLVEAGLATNPSDPIGGLAEALTAAALWPGRSVQDAYMRARGVRTSFDASGTYGPALGSMPSSATRRRNPLVVDLAVSWKAITERVVSIRDFARQRRGERWAWDTATNTAPCSSADVPPEDRYSGLARVQVKARFAPDAPFHGDLDALPFSAVRDGAIPANDLFVLVMFARMDELERSLQHANFVWTAILLSNECVRSLDPGTGSEAVVFPILRSAFSLVGHRVGGPVGVVTCRVV